MFPRKTVALFFVIPTLMFPLSGCSEKSGALIGGLVGGASCYLIAKAAGGSSKQRNLAAAACMVLTSVVGSKLAKHMNKEDKKKVQAAILEGKSRSWKNPKTGKKFLVKPDRKKKVAQISVWDDEQGFVGTDEIKI